MDIESCTSGDRTRFARIASGSPPAATPPPRNPMKAGARGRHNWSQVARVRPTYLTRRLEEQKSSAAGTRTRVERVRTQYPNQLEYSGVGATYLNIVCSESENSKEDRTEPGGIKASGGQAGTRIHPDGWRHPRVSHQGCADRFCLPSRYPAPVLQSHVSRGARTAELVPSRSREDRLPYTATAKKKLSATGN